MAIPSFETAGIYGGSIYTYLEGTNSFDDARNKALELQGGDLVAISSSGENKFVFDVFADDKANITIGAKDMDPRSGVGSWAGDTHQHFEWVALKGDNDPNTEHRVDRGNSDYHNWDSGQPNNWTNKNCNW